MELLLEFLHQSVFVHEDGPLFLDRLPRCGIDRREETLHIRVLKFVMLPDVIEIVGVNMGAACIGHDCAARDEPNTLFSVLLDSEIHLGVERLRDSLLRSVRLCDRGGGFLKQREQRVVFLDGQRRLRALGLEGLIASRSFTLPPTLPTLRSLDRGKQGNVSDSTCQALIL